MFEMQNLRNLMAEQYTEAHFEALLQIIDRLHDAAAVNNLSAVCEVDARIVVGWLDDIIFTAEETIRELQATIRPEQEVVEWAEN
jgi:hypothetical protein